MSTSEPSDSVIAMLIDGEDDQEVHELQTDARTPIPKQRREISPSLSSNYGGDGDEGRRKKVLALSDTEGLFCPICMEAWESQGDHQVRLEIQIYHLLGFPGIFFVFLENLLVCVGMSVEFDFCCCCCKNSDCLIVLESLIFVLIQ